MNRHPVTKRHFPTKPVTEFAKWNSNHPFHSMIPQRHSQFGSRTFHGHFDHNKDKFCEKCGNILNYCLCFYYPTEHQRNGYEYRPTVVQRNFAKFGHQSRIFSTTYGTGCKFGKPVKTKSAYRKFRDAKRLREFIEQKSISQMFPYSNLTDDEFRKSVKISSTQCNTNVTRFHHIIKTLENTVNTLVEENKDLKVKCSKFGDIQERYEKIFSDYNTLSTERDSLMEALRNADREFQRLGTLRDEIEDLKYENKILQQQQKSPESNLLELTRAFSENFRTELKDSISDLSESFQSLKQQQNGGISQNYQQFVSFPPNTNTFQQQQPNPGNPQMYSYQSPFQQNDGYSHGYPQVSRNSHRHRRHHRH